MASIKKYVKQRAVKDPKTGETKMVPVVVWRARYRDESGKEHTHHFPRQTDAKRWIDEVTTSIITGQYVHPRAGKITFAAYYETWEARQVWETNTRRSVRVAVASVTFADLSLSAIKKTHVQEWVKAMIAAGLAASTIHTRFMNAHSVLLAAIEGKLIASDPCKDVDLPRLRKAEFAMNIPAPEQVGAVMSVADDSFRLFISLCAFTGLRLGEASALQVGDFNFLKRELHVARQVQYVRGGTFEIRSPKYESERDLYLPDDLLEMLAAHIGTLPPSKERWLFLSHGEDPVHPNTVARRWRKALTESGVPRFKLHDLRHFFASGLIAEGCDVVVVQKAMGHAHASTTLNTYSHIWPKAADRTRKAAGVMMRAATAPIADSLRTGTSENGSH